MSGPRLRTNDGKITRNDKMNDGRNELTLATPRVHALFTRTTEATYATVLTLVGSNPDIVDDQAAPKRPKPYANRCVMVQDLVKVGDKLHDTAFRLGVKDHHHLLDTALATVEQLEMLAAKLNYRDWRDLLDDGIASLEFLMKKKPLPAFARIEDTPLLSSPAKSEQADLL